MGIILPVDRFRKFLSLLEGEEYAITQLTKGELRIFRLELESNLSDFLEARIEGRLWRDELSRFAKGGLMQAGREVSSIVRTEERVRIVILAARRTGDKIRTYFM